jgi:dodecin
MAFQSALCLYSRRLVAFAVMPTFSSHVFHFGVEDMSVAKIIEISSGSSKSFEDAVQSGVSRASETVKNITGAWVQEQKVVVEKGKVVEYRVNIKVTFILDEPKPRSKK